MNKKQWIKKKRKRKRKSECWYNFKTIHFYYLNYFFHFSILLIYALRAYVSKTLYNIMFTTLFNKIFICLSVGSVFIGISKHLVKKTVPADKPLPTAISFFNFQLRLSIRIGFWTPLIWGRNGLALQRWHREISTFP